MPCDVAIAEDGENFTREEIPIRKIYGEKGAEGAMPGMGLERKKHRDASR